MPDQATKKIPKGYKQTEVGIIPSDWGVKEMNDMVVSISSGKSKTFSEIGDCPIYGSTGIIGYRKSHDYHGDKVLIARVGANAGMVNKVTGEYCVSDNTLIVTYQDNIDINFSYYQLINFRLNRMIFGSGQPLVTGSQIKKIKFAIPSSKKEQTTIAATLSDAGALINNLEKLIAKKRAIKQGAMQGLLTGKRRLPGFRGKWEVKKLGDIADISKGSGLSKSKLSVSGSTKCILYGELFTTYDHVIREVVSRTSSDEGKTSEYGDVLMPGATTTIGIDLATASALLEKGVLLGGDINIIRQRKKSYNSEFLAYVLSHVKKNDIAEITQGITIIHLYGRDLVDLEVKLPLLLREQTATVKVLSDMAVDIEQLEKKRDKYKAIKQGMMQMLLTGKIRLI